MSAPTDDPGSVRAKYRNAAGFADRPAAAAEAAPFRDDPIAERAAAAASWTPSDPGPVGSPVTRIESATAEVRTPVIAGRTEAAKRGFRGKMNRTFGLHLSKGEDELRYDQRVSQIQKTLRVPKRFGVISGKGAAGKTTVSLMLGETICAQQRGMKVVAMSIDPLGNISDRVRPVNAQAPRSVMALAADDNLNRASDVSSYLQTTKNGLRVLGASAADGARFLTPDALDRATESLLEHYEVIVVDFGLNVDAEVYHRALGGVGGANGGIDQLVLVTSTTADSISELHTIIKTMLSFGGRYVELLKEAIVVFCQTRPGKSHIDVDAERDRVVNSYGMPVVTIPFDEHIAEGGPIGLELLDEDTRLQFVHLAAEVMSKIPVD
jgi:MinD-like ATPase involved in chromosome partitioning or flagellar assembly